MSSISQMERSSSQTRMLAMEASSCPGCGRGGPLRHQHPRFFRQALISPTVIAGGCALGIKTSQAQNERGSLPWFRSGPHLALMGLDNLVDNREAEAGAAFEIGLEGL